MPHRLHVACVTMMLVPVAACGNLGIAGDAGTDGDGASPRTVYLVLEDDGSDVDLPLDWKLVVSLRENPSLGCSWEIVELDASALENTGERWIPEGDPRPDVTGMAGTAEWEFEPVSEGTTVLRLEMLQGGDPCTDEMVTAVFGESFGVTVNVTAG